MHVPQVSHKPYRTFLCLDSMYVRPISLTALFSCLDLSDRNKTCLSSLPESIARTLKMTLYVSMRGKFDCITGRIGWLQENESSYVELRCLVAPNIFYPALRETRA